MFDKILIANRGEIAVRILKTLKRLNIASVVVYSEADVQSKAVLLADEAICIGPAQVSQSYLNVEKILEVAKQTGAQAIHPGYGLLSENADFAQGCEDHGIKFLGPTPEQIKLFGLKHTARELAEHANVPLLPGTELLADVATAKAEAEGIGFPVMLKSTAGGGGIGMQLCYDAEQLEKSWETVERLGKNNFGNGGIFLEKYISKARHVEVQIFGDGQGDVVALGERDCTIQRRNQKVIEETPAPNLSESQRNLLNESAVSLGKSVKYRSAGTVEFILDTESGEAYFLEVNTRLQVEHRVTEAVFGVDLVEWMIRAGSNEGIDLQRFSSLSPKGHSIQVRLYAENPLLDFQPSIGEILEVDFPEEKNGLIVDTWVDNGSKVSAYYDPLIAKLIVHSDDRDAALEEMATALESSRLFGIQSNKDYLTAILKSRSFVEFQHTTQFLNSFEFRSPHFEVLSPGTQTTVQDYPGRCGYWDVGVPPSGAMDSLSFRLGNQILGNASDAAGLEILMSGPTLKFYDDSWICLTGAPIAANVDGNAVSMWQPVFIQSGQVLEIGQIPDGGARAYLSIAGGLSGQLYLGSRSTFTLGNFGGFTGKALCEGDFIEYLISASEVNESGFESIHPQNIPNYADSLEIEVTYGPHGAPDFFTEQDIEKFFESEWEIHYNSARTGVRLIGPKPEWARKDGGEAGLHPSNIHDNAYAIGSIDFTGDMPIILGPDGPSLGGFVCPATIIRSELWKMGQLRPGMKIRFKPVSMENARQADDAYEKFIQTPSTLRQIQLSPMNLGSPVLTATNSNSQQPFDVCYRCAGDQNILIEYGEMVLDFHLRFRVHALQEKIRSAALHGILELTPGIRSLQVKFDPTVIAMGVLVDALKAFEAELPDVDSMEVPIRKVYLPLSWDDEQTRLAIQKYEQIVRPGAPWCPSNIEFIRRINGLDSVEDVKKVLFDAQYMVLGLGDVYLGAPVATPIDPRHRLVTTKYNPARTWTPENAVGIGGAYLCVYGMEGPGGYQFVGRTLQMWNRFRSTADFEPGKPWLLRFFDQISFFPVSHDELTQIRSDFLQGKYKLKTEDAVFNLSEYDQFLQNNATDINAFKQKQQQAFETERLHWVETGQDQFDEEETAILNEEEIEEVPEGCIEIKAPMPGSIWKILVEEGDAVEADETVVILEAMKMEVVIPSLKEGKVVKLFGSEGQTFSKGQTLAWIQI